MPLCKSKVEEITAEDLVELSEIEKYNLGEVWNVSTSFLIRCLLEIHEFRSRISYKAYDKFVMIAW